MQNRKQLLSTLCVLALFTATFAQTTAVDSLWTVFESAETDSTKVDALNWLSEAYQNNSFEVAKNYAHRALRYAKKINYRPGVFHAFNNLGICHDYTSNPDSARYYYQKSLEVALVLNDDFSASIAHNNLGVYYVYRGNYPLALEYLQKALKYNTQPSDYMDPVIAYANIGLIHEDQGDTAKAIEYYQHAAEACLGYDNIGYSAYADLNYGYIHLLRSQYQEAIHFFKNAEKKYQEINDTRRLAETLYYLGKTHWWQGTYQQALNYYLESLKRYRAHDATYDIPSMYACIAEAYDGLGNHEKAFEYYQKSEELAEEIQSPYDQLKAYEKLASKYAAMNDFKQAFDYQKKFQTIKDTIYSTKSRERIIDMENNFEIQLKEEAFQKLKAERSKNEAIIQQRTSLAIFSIIIVLLVSWIALLLFQAYRQKKTLNQSLETKVAERTAALEHANKLLAESNNKLEKSNELFRQSNEELERFTFIMSHDLKEPLRNITSFVNLLQRKVNTEENPDTQEFMRYIVTGTQQMHTVIEDMLNYSRVANIEETKPETVNMNTLLEEVKATLQSAIKEKNAQVTFDEMPVLSSQKTHLLIILKNLVENGIKYNKSATPKVHITHTAQNGHHEFQVKDNGLGISPEYQEQVFEMFKRLHNRDEYPGSGMGLAICKKIVNSLNGKIWLESHPGEGSTFSFTLPN